MFRSFFKSRKWLFWAYGGGLFLLMALFEPFIYFLGESYGLLYVSSTVAAVIVATIPLISPLFAWYFFREKLNFQKDL